MSIARSSGQLSKRPSAQLNEATLRELIGYQLALIRANPGLSPAPLRKALALSALRHERPGQAS